MRVLALSSLAPLPANHAVRRMVWNILTRLPGDVHLITWRTNDVSDDDIDRIGERLPLTTVLPTRPISLRPASRALRQTRFLLGGNPPYVQAVMEERNLADANSRPRFSSFVEDLDRRSPFDVVIVFEEAMTQTPLPLMNAPVVVHRLNLLTEVLAEQRATSVWARTLWPIERRGWERFDQRTMRHCDLAVSNTDYVADGLKELYPDHRIEALNNGTDVKPLRTPPEERKDVVFVGWMGYEPNVDAVSWFVSQVWPHVRKRHPEAGLRIIGREPAPQVTALGGRDGITVTGEVPDVSEAAEGAAVGVVPLRRGRGMKSKTIELMAMGLPVVSLPTGTEGIAAARAEGLIEVPDSTAMIDEVSALLDDRPRAGRIGQLAQTWVTRNHGWDAIVARYSELLASTSSR